MTDVGQAFLDKSRHLLLSDYLPKIERSLAMLSDDDIWWRPNEASNSIGNLMLHLCGNATQWIIGGVGKRPFERHRQQEFDERRQISSAELMTRLRSVIEQADDVMRTTHPAVLLDERDIQGYRVTVLQAIYHVVEHFGMHTGQIILLSKARRGEDLRLWEAPPKARSG
jgi:uncharacterized damage-inducible protein DinB